MQLVRVLVLIFLCWGVPVVHAAATESPPPIVPEDSVGDAVTDDDPTRSDTANAEAESGAEGLTVTAIAGIAVVSILLASALFYFSRRKN